MFEYNGEGNFGELALLYNMPRAATGSGAISSAFLLSSLQLLFTFLCLLDVNYHLYTLIMSLVLGRSIIGKSDFQSTCNAMSLHNLQTSKQLY